MSKCDNLLIGFSTMAYRKNDARKDRAVRELHAMPTSVG